MKPVSQKGFTIVELLIVIVVIAILAAITVTAFSGVQERAEDASISSAVNGYVKILGMYKSNIGSYPPGEWLCLGASGDYPAIAPFALNQCNTSTNNYWDQALADSLAPYISSRLPYPAVKARTVDASGGKSRGLIYDQSSAHTAGKGTITYYREGQKTCPVGILREYRYSNTVTVCNYVLD